MWYEILLEKGWLPETLLRWGIRSKIKGRIKSDPVGNKEVKYQNTLFNQLFRSPIAIHEDDANEQHYELPSEFFKIILGPRLKYSCCYFEEDYKLPLAEAEEKMLEFTVSRADVKDGQTILDLGCGWGSLTLYLAEKFPNSEIIALSNSSIQREFIEKQIKSHNYSNVKVITANIATHKFDPSILFDRILSVEMFEHMRNYPALLEKLSGWLVENGRLFVHMFARQGAPYLFEVEDTENFMAKYFFTGGTMLNIENLPVFAQNHFELEKVWQIAGTQYSYTLERWLDLMKGNKEELIPILQDTYGSEFQKWWEYWKIFFIVCSELFKFDKGEEWVVMHYLFKKR